MLGLSIRQRHPITAMYNGCRRQLCPHRLGWNNDEERRVLCYQYGGDSVSGLDEPGARSNWRCLAVEKLSEVELMPGPWHTAPNHSRPQTCIVRVEMDVEDQPEDNPQNGQRATCRSRWRAIMMRRVAMEQGLCRSGRTRAAGPEVRRQLGRW
jgi:hypothetical protein